MIPHRHIDAILKPHYVYRLYDDGDRLLYVGCTYQPHKRPYRHKHLSPARVVISEAMSCYDAYSEEARAIREEQPERNNRIGTSFPASIRSQVELEAAMPTLRWLQRSIPVVPGRQVTS